MSDSAFSLDSTEPSCVQKLIDDLQEEIRRLRSIIDGRLFFSDRRKDLHSPNLVADNSDYTEKLSNIYKFRRRREAIFPCKEIFSEPGWDILIDLILSEKAGKRISISSACLASSAPATTALRWLAVLEQNGLVEREQDRRDGRRQFVKPTKISYKLMQELMNEFD